MTFEEPKILRLQLSHQLIGIQNFDVSSRDNFSDLRAMLTENTQMGIFENFRFTLNGKLLSEFQEIGQIVQNQTRILLVLQPFYEKSSYYHLQRVKQVISNPMEWVILNTRDNTDDKQSQSPHLPANVTIDNFLDQQLSSALFEPQLPNSFQFFQSLNFSIHNPPQMQRRLAGDFYYLMVRTLQGHQEHITACPQGFYLNNSTNSYLGTTNIHNMYFYNLLDLLRYCSPKFKQEFNNLRNIYKLTELDKSIFNSFKFSPMTEWLKTNPTKKMKINHWKHANSSFPSENMNITEWNEIIQRHSILISDSLIDVSNKEKNQYKLYQDYINFAKQAAVKVVDGQISPLRSSDPLIKRVFCYGSVFIWFAEDHPLLYTKQINGHATRRKMNIEIRNLGMMERSKNVMVNYLHYVLINYKGHNVVVQPIILGIPSNFMNQSTSVGIRGEKCVDEIASSFKIEGSNIFRDSKQAAERAFVHPQLRTFKAEDNRNYIMNLHSLSPRDLNFLTPKNNASVLRKQLISSFNNKQNCTTNVNTMIESGYNLVFNEKITQQHLKLKSIKTYAQEIVVPLCLKSFLKENRKYLADSKSVVGVLHKFGLGSRYLGMMFRKAHELELNHIQIIIQRVIIVKTLKNIFREAMRKTELGDLKQTICQLLNCLFSSSIEQPVTKDDNKDEISTNASKKKRKKVEFQWEVQEQNYVIKPVLTKATAQKYGQIKPQQLWDQIKEIAKFRYGIDFQEKKICLLRCLDNEYGKCAALRDLCISIGICVQKTEYFQKSGTIFKVQNIEYIKPIAKSISISNRFLQNLIQQGDLCIQKKRVEEAIDFYNQAINYATTIFGIMTEQLSTLNKKIAQIYFRIEEVDAAMLFIHCALKMSQKIYGQSHVETIQCYNLSSQFNFFLRNFQTAEFYLIKSIHLSTVSYGEEYPELIVFYLNLATIYEATFRFMDSITCAGHALRIALKIFGENHLNTAICYSSMSALHFEIPDIEKSIFFQTKSIQILKKIISNEDPRLKEAEKLLEYYYQLQMSKKVKENHEKEKKKMVNQQIFAGFPFFRLSDYNMNGKDREQMYRKMHNFMQSPNKFFI